VFSQPNGGHLRLRPHPPLCFSMGCVSAPKTRDRGAARAHPMARAFHGSIGSGGAMSWWRRWPTHGERGLKPLEGRAAAAHVGCCVLWLCLVLCSRTFYPFCRVEHPTKGDICPHFNAITNALVPAPSRADTSQCTGEVSAAVKKGGGS
jgi:hypothetical protein